ncbi:MAG: RNA polymerase sigma factor [Deltaproteobacteria bacterium]|nr:RNA polymerase sigma factor [Deltaproteobacteria bacterium]
MRDTIKPGHHVKDPRQDGRELFDRIVLPLRDELMRKAMRVTGDAADAEDLVQESLLKALCAVHTLEDPARARAWVHTIMHNTFATMCRKNARRPSFAIEPAEMDAMESRAPQRSAGLCFDLERAMVGLDTAFRDAVVLCDLEGFSYEEAAGTIGCPVGTLMSRLYRARRKLRSALDGPEQLTVTA